jgi:vitamin-K-epoxide reductase (warfarin-sensitive)
MLPQRAIVMACGRRLQSRRRPNLRYVFILLALAGIIVSSLALREHYREDTSPCSINDKWDCGIVNKSSYAVIAGVPVAVIGIAGYFLMGVLGGLKRYRFLLVATLCGLAFSLYLTYIEANVLGVWCIYCVMSLGIISLLTLFAILTVIVPAIRNRQSEASS